jgi:hypothetical protein
VTERNGTEYLAVLGERDRSAAIHTYIRNHPLDRPGVMAYLKKEVPA